MKQFVIKSLNIEERDEKIYITGYASSTAEDLDGEQITEEALKKAVEQITQPPYNKVFIGHAPLTKINKSPEDEIPIGKVVEAELREEDGKKKLWIKVLLNKDHPRFEEIFKSIQNGFLDSFSIGFEVLRRKGNLITEIRILETSIVGIPTNPDATVEDTLIEKQAGGRVKIKGVSPKHPFKYGVDTESPWRKPRLQDFTDKRWDELSDDEKIFIEGHYAWSPKSPPDRFTDLKFPHHNPTKHPKPHAVNKRGVIAGFVRLAVTKLGEEDRKIIYDHLAKHYRDDLGLTPPEFKSIVGLEDGFLSFAFKELGIEELRSLIAELEQEDVCDRLALKSLNLFVKNMEDLEKKIEELEKTNADLQRKLLELEEEIKKLKEEKAKLEEEKKSLETKLKELIEEKKAELIEEIKSIQPDVNEEELKQKDISELKDIALKAYKSKFIKLSGLPSKLPAGNSEGGTDWDEIFGLKR